MEIAFFLPVIPPRVTAQARRATKRADGTYTFYDTPELRDARMKFLANLAQYRPEKPLAGPVRLYTRWYWQSARGLDGWKVSRPDTDNLLKLFKDCMTVCGFWNDDAQVCSETTEKCWGQIPGIAVRVEEIKA